ncbi:hypothetical protein [Archangium primigenium]|uniref:hypothetical protein n=1 Tax=[Archangium] primigenium TaxID=2792470 RepID=UPI001956D106|nr:hypothetical protein [Archangium primigenium]MBM7112249.1 hypothetical protein [Archangium primigenium]
MLNRDGRRTGRSGRVALACAGPGLLVLLWSAALPPADAWTPPLPTPQVLASAPQGRGAPARREPAAVEIRASPAPAPVPASFAPTPVPSVSPPSAGVVLPLAAHELASDGLPVSAMRCTPGAEGLSCGSCRADGDCPQGQGCVANRQTRRFECMASECEADGHCFPGDVCRAVTTGATGIVVRRCAPEGVRGPGEPCDALPLSAAGSCREGLRCVNQVCAPPCTLDGRVRCEAGFTCAEGLEGPGCFPDCQRRGCAEGQHCARVREGDYQCLQDAQGACQDSPCAEGERCNLRMSRGRATFWCARVCDSTRQDSCGAGQVCGMGSATASTCFRQCDPLAPEPCQSGWSCATVTEDMSVFGCTPALAP